MLSHLGGDDTAFYCALGALDDVAEQLAVRVGDERDGPSGAAGAGRAPDAVDVLLEGVGHVEVNHDLWR